MKRIYKAINEGLNLIDFGNSKIQKSLKMNNAKFFYDWLAYIKNLPYKEGYRLSSDYLMPLDVYNELCENEYINFYKPTDKIEFKKIMYGIYFLGENKLRPNNIDILNLNWIDFTIPIELQFFRNAIEICMPFGFIIDVRYSNIDWTNKNLTFCGNSAIKSILLPKTLTTVKEHLFINTALNYIEIPNNVTTIKNGAFGECGYLKTIKLPNTLNYIGDEAFYNCRRLTYIDYNGTIEEWKSIYKGYGSNYLMKNYSIKCTDGITDIWNRQKYSFE